MATEVSITLFGHKFFQRRIRAMRYRARDMSPVLERIGDEWLDIIEEQFSTEGARGGTPWRALSRETKFRRGSAHPILIDTGDLLLETTDPSNIRVTDDEVTLDLGREVVARSHQYGFQNQKANRSVPARPIVAFTEFDVKRWRAEINDFLVNGRL